MPKKLPSDIQNSIKALLENSADPAVIGKRVGVHRNTVNRYANKWMHDGIRKRGGRPSIVAESTRRYIKRQVLTGCLKAAKDVQMKLEELGHPMSYQSAINVLHSVEIYAEIKKKKPLLTEKHKKARLVWAKKHQYWTVHDWRRVIFSDETKINIWGSDGCKYYWKRKCDHLQPQHIDVTVKHGGGGLMLGSCITSEGPGYACQIYDGTMNSEEYQEILGTSLKDTMEYYGLNWETSVFQHDNDPKHRSKSTTQWMKDSGMIYIDDWPSQSPDLNPIEHTVGQNTSQTSALFEVVVFWITQ
ncbi:hypothetical protein G6F64_011589 [Rhizopus arrhizus]|uniref:Transposase Tc1-like domain-containing protein n=1 Tax=Rhizopus oryzae TaxID=64495 RepID=A0A9P6WYY5_RHIOR|nr:hypothetical protein G6F64_011589 [Rhizopus arrhizus]